jgi:hypothetical protein
VLCEQRNVLISACGDTTRFYRFATVALRLSCQSRDSRTFTELVRLCDDARSQCQIARKILDSHIVEHGCASSPEAPQAFADRGWAKCSQRYNLRRLLLPETYEYNEDAFKALQNAHATYEHALEILIDTDLSSDGMLAIRNQGRTYAQAVKRYSDAAMEWLIVVETHRASARQLLQKAKAAGA